MKPWIEALRLRTLPLSLVGAIVASGCAAAAGVIRSEVCALLVLTVLLLQVLCNFADEYGDLKKGADTDIRIGPVRGMQRGEISFAQMKWALLALSALTLASGIALVLVALGLNLVLIAIFLAMGLFALFAAIGYTVGKHAYGYYGLGDIFCLVCFGYLAVCGGFFLYAQTVSLPVVLAAMGTGLLIVSVLNLNNMRDCETDAATGKRTLVVRIGGQTARAYHVFLLLGGAVFNTLAAALIYLDLPLGLLHLAFFVLSSVPLLINLRATLQVKVLKDYDRLMRPLSLSIVLQSLTFAVLAGVFI